MDRIDCKITAAKEKFIEKAIKIANSRQIIFKLHPNENIKRATVEVNKYAQGSLIFDKMKAEVLIANCETLVTRYSSVVYVGLALGKEVFSDFDVEDLIKFLPLQNSRQSAENIAAMARVITDSADQIIQLQQSSHSKTENVYNPEYLFNKNLIKSNLQHHK